MAEASGLLDLLRLLGDHWLIVAFVFGLIWYISTVLNDPLRVIPGPPGWPILGNTLEFGVSVDQHSLLLKWAKQYGGIFKYYLVFGGYRIHITDPNIAKHVLVTNCKNYRRHDVLKKILPGFGDGLITANGFAHAIQRKQLNPFFSLARVERYLPLFLQKTNELVKRWKLDVVESEDHSVDCNVLEGLTHVSLDVIGLSAFGYNFDCVLTGETEESKATDIVLKGHFDLQNRSMEALFPPLRYLQSKIQAEFARAENSLERLIDKVIHQQKAGVGCDIRDGSCNASLLAIFSSMKNERGDRLSPKEIYHQVFTFLVSGHETISLTGTWTLYLLSKYPEWQSDLRQEIKRAVGDGEISWKDLDKLTILDNCIKESLRLYPIALTTDRTAIGPDRLGPYRIPGGTNVMIGNGTLHRDEMFWKDPDVFRPSRFDLKYGEDCKLLPYYFLPFSRGPRMCIGHRFATVALKVMLAKIINEFSFSFKDGDHHDDSIPEFPSISTLTLKPYPPLVLKMALVATE